MYFYEFIVYMLLERNAFDSIAFFSQCDLAPSDYHLFRSLQNHLNGKTFDSNEVVKNKLIQFFASKNQTFYESGIMKLTERWQQVIEQNGQYIID